MKKSALKNRIKSYWGKHKTAIFVVALSFQLAIGLTIYFLFGRISPNDDIFVPEEGSVAFLMNENPKFSVDFGKVKEPDKQWVRFEAQTSSNNPFEEEKGNIFTKIAKLFQKQERYGIEMSLVGVDLKGEDLKKYGDEVILVADVIGTNSVKTSTELIDLGREIGVYEDQEVPVSKQTVLNKDVADGVDLEYQILKGLGLKEEIIIRDLEAYKDSCKEKGCSLPVNEFVFDLKMDSGVELREGWFTVDGQSTSTYYFVDSKGRYIAHFLPNFAIDNINNKTFDVNLKVEKGEDDNYRAKVTVNLEWLLSSERVFPVRIDPSIVHDDTADFSGGIFNRIESVTGPKVQIDSESYNAGLDCSGGKEIMRDGYKIHVFETSGTLTCNSYGNAEVLVVGGGGGGGANYGNGGNSGGGGGGVVHEDSFSISGNVSVTVGNGGAAGSSGSDSVFSSLTAEGGGYGAYSAPGADGGSGGGGNPGGSGSQGGDGGQSYTGVGNYSAGGGGGGAGGNGEAAGTASGTVNGGDGGVGSSEYSDLLEVAGVGENVSGVYYIAGGGGGGDYGDPADNTSGFGGDGGGGDRTENGTKNHGGGGGGACEYPNSTNFPGGAGGSGVVVVRYFVGSGRSSGEYISGSLDMEDSMSEATLSWTPSGVNTGNGETPYSTTGLVAQWNLNETSGTTADNVGSCGATCDGTLTNFASTGSQDAAAGTGWTADNKRWGAGALMFDATNDYVSVGDLSELELSNVSLSAWVRLNNKSGWLSIVRKFDSNNFQGYQIGLNGTSGGTPYFQVGNGTANSSATSGGLAIYDGQWHYLVGTYDGTNLEFYIDGVNVGSNTSTAISYGTQVFYIGYNGWNTVDGVIDSVSVYSRALSADEVLSNYQAGNIEFQYRVSTDNSTWSSWTSYGTSASDLAWESFDYSTYLGDGADGALAPSGTFNLNTSTSGSRSYADGVAYKVTSNPSANSIVTVDTPNGLAAGDEIMLINLKGTSTDYADVGNYEFLEVDSVNTGTKTITTVGKIMKSYDGTTFSNQNVVIQRVPNYTSVTLDSTDIINASGWEGLTTTPTGAAGYYTGIVAFRATGTVTVGSTASISADGLGYRGGVGTWYSGRGTGGETYGGDSGSGGYTSTSAQYAGLAGFGGGGGGGYATGTSGGGAGQLGSGGGAGGGAYNATAWKGRAGGGGGGGNGTVGSGGRTYSSTYGASGSGFNGGNGSSSLVSSSAYGGGGGGGGISSYDNGTKKLFFGGGGGAGGGSSTTSPACAAGSDGGQGGGIVFISSNAISLSGNINADGEDGFYDDCGGSLSLNPGGGGGGAGGTVKIYSNTSISGSGTTTVAYGVGGIPPSSTDYGWGGNGGLGLLSIIGISETQDTTIKMEGTGSTRYESGVLEADQYTVGLWHLDERGGSSAYIKDSSANALHGTPNGTTYTNFGKVGGARNFDEHNDYVSIPALGWDYDNITIEAWVRPSTLGNRMTVIDMGAETTLVPILEVGPCSGRTKAVCVVTPGVWQAETGSDVISTDVWTHIAYTKSGPGATHKIYVNGVLQTLATNASANYASTSVTKRIGARLTAQDFYGAIDEVRVSNIARTGDEIANSYRLGRDTYINKAVDVRDLSSSTTLPVYIAGDRPGSYLNAIWGETPYSNYQPDPNTVGLWHLDEASGTGAYLLDSSGMSAHGTPSGASYTENGKLGGSRTFVSGDDISLGSLSVVDSAGNITVDAWLYPTEQTAATAYRAFTESWVLSVGQYGSQAAFYMGDASSWTHSETAGGALAINSWNYVTYVKSGTSASIYINGVLSKSGITAPATLGTSSSTNYISTYNGGSNSWVGGIDEVRISNIVRTADEIRQSYEIGLRTHPVQIDFGASLVSGNLITGSGDTSFNIDATVYVLEELGSELYVGEKVIVKENYDGTEYIAQGTVSAITASTGAVTVSSWDSGSTFPSAGYTVNADVFKWQKEYIPIKNRTVSTHVDAVNLLSLNITDGYGGRNIWIDDLRSTSGYLSTYTGEELTFPSSGQYFQYKTIFSTWDISITPYISQVQLDYFSGPTLDLLMRHGKWFNSSGEKQPFWWVNTP